MKCKVSAMAAIMVVAAAVLIIPAGGTTFAQTTGSIEVVQNPNGPIADDFNVIVPNGGFDMPTIDFKPHIMDNGTETAVGDLTVELISYDVQPLLTIIGGSTGPNDGSRDLGTLVKPNQTVTLEPRNNDAFVGGSYTYTYMVTDGQGLTDTGLLGITVEPIEVFARLHDQSYAIYHNTELVVSVSDMIDRNQIYTWPEDLRDSAEIVSAGNPTNGMTESNSTSFTYTPNTTFEGDDSFDITVQITDNASMNHTRDATVTVYVVQQICNTAVTGSLSFGELYDGQESEDQEITISNSGNVPNAITIRGEDWLAGSDKIMEIGTTKYSTASGTDYSAKTALTDTETDVVRLVNGTGAGTNTSIHMQVQLNLLNSSFTGNIQQTVTVGSNCNITP